MWVKTQDNSLIADVDGMGLKENRGHYQLVGFCKNGQEITLHSWEQPDFALDRIESFAKFAETGSHEVFVVDWPEVRGCDAGLPLAEKMEGYYFPG